METHFVLVHIAKMSRSIVRENVLHNKCPWLMILMGKPSQRLRVHDK